MDLYLKEQIAFLDILLFILGAFLVVTSGMVLGSWLRPYRPNIEKLSSYESGEEPLGSAWIPFNARFYGIALIFILFEIETILLFPWALVWNEPCSPPLTHTTWTYYAALIGTSFIVILAIALVYAYKHGHFHWSKQTTVYPSLPSAIPQEYYERINRYYASKKMRYKQDKA